MAGGKDPLHAGESTDVGEEGKIMSETTILTYADLDRQESGRRDTYWQEHSEHAEAARSEACNLCGFERWGFPYVWWRFPATERLRTTKGTGGLPELACPQCYTRYRYLTEVQVRSAEDALLQLLKDRNWRLWLRQLEQNGGNDATIVEGPQAGRFAYVVQHYVRGNAHEGEEARSDFFPIPCYTVATADGQLDEWEEEAINWMRVEEGHDYSVTLWREENLRGYLRHPEAWLARQSDRELLTVEQAAERVGVSAKTLYEYCTQWYAYGEYNAYLSEEGEREQPGKRAKKNTRKIYNVRTANGIRVPAWTVDLFKMWYEQAPLLALITTAYDLMRLLSPNPPSDPERLCQETVTWTPIFEVKSEGGSLRKVLVGAHSDDPAWDTPTFQRQFETWLAGAEGRDGESETRGDGYSAQ
jgi:hypothetical protein